MTTLLVFLLFSLVLGLVVGSYLAGRTYRVIHELPIESLGRSYCPDCKNTLSWHHLVPAFSYLLLRGKCAFCKKDISSRYFFIEITTGFLFLVTTWAMLGTVVPEMINALLVAKLFFAYAFFAMLVYISIIDLALFAFPVVGLMISTGGILVLELLFGIPTEFLDGLLAAFAFGGLLTAIRMTGSYVFKKEVMGEGDLYLAVFLGAALGIQGSIISFYISIIIGGILAAYILFSKKGNENTQIPFGPLLAIGGIVSFLFSSHIMAWYLGMFL